MAARTTTAPTVPHQMVFLRKWSGRLRAARAMTMALSPASTKSIKTMAKSADHQAFEKSSMRQV